MIEKYNVYIKENTENYKFKVGDIVICTNRDSKHFGKEFIIFKKWFIPDSPDLYKCTYKQGEQILTTNITGKFLKKKEIETYKDEDIEWFIGESNDLKKFKVGDICLYVRVGSKDYGKKIRIDNIGKDFNSDFFDCRIVASFIDDDKKNYRLVVRKFKDIEKIEKYDEENIQWFENKLYEKHIPSNEDIGKKVKIRPDSMFYSQAYEKNGDGYGVIINYNTSFKEVYCYEINWNNGHRNQYRLEDIEFVETEKYDEENIQWFENKLYEKHIPSNEDIGKKVKIRPESQYIEQAYENGGDGYGTIFDINNGNFLCYRIKWNNGHKNSYGLHDIEFIETEKYKDEDIQWFENNKFELIGSNLIGKKVKIRDDSMYKNEAYEKKGDGFGIIKYSSELHGKSHIYTIRWTNGHEDIYIRKDFDLIEPEDYSNIQWFESNDDGLMVPDTMITVKDGDTLALQLIDKLSFVIQKRSIKSVRVKSVNGYANKKTHNGNKIYYETYLETEMTNKDFIIGEYNSRTDNIKIIVNDKVVFDLDSKHFDNEELIDKMANVYKKYLSKGNYKLYENDTKSPCRYMNLSNNHNESVR
jgi:flagellar hook assembly protein FlgD